MPERRARRYWLVQWSGGGGFGHYAWLLADAIAGTGEDVVLATRRSHELADMPRRHAVLGLWRDAPPLPRSRVRSARILGHRVLGWLALVREIHRRRGSGDIVHLQGADRVWELPFVLLIRLLGATVVSTAHNARPHDATAGGRWRLRLLHRVPHVVLTHTEEAARAVGELGGADVTVRVVWHPSFAPIADHFGTAAHPAAGDPPRVAHLGTVRPYKGLDVVIGAVRDARATHPDLALSVVGLAGDAAGVRASLAALPAGAASAELEHVPIARLVDEARASDVVMLGHRSHSESGVAHLALGAGAVVVAPNTAAIGRLLAGEPSWRYDPSVPGDAARVLSDVVTSLTADRAGHRGRARALADAVPSWDALAAVTLRIVADAAGRAQD